MAKRYIAWNGDHDLKHSTVAQMRQHREADRLIQGMYIQGDPNGDAWRGSNIGCLAQGKGHADVAELLNCPLQIPYLMDTIFECLPIDAARAWAVDNIEAIPVGADLTHVWPRIAVWLLTDAQYGAMRYAATDEGRAAIRDVADVYQTAIDNGDEVDVEAMRRAAVRVGLVAEVAAYTAAYAAHAAHAARAAYAVGRVAEVAAYTAAYAADIVAAQVARTAYWLALRDTMLDVLRNAPIVEESHHD